MLSKENQRAKAKRAKVTYLCDRNFQLHSILPLCSVDLHGYHGIENSVT